MHRSEIFRLMSVQGLNPNYPLKAGMSAFPDCGQRPRLMSISDTLIVGQTVNLCKLRPYPVGSLRAQSGGLTTLRSAGV